MTVQCYFIHTYFNFKFKNPFRERFKILEYILKTCLNSITLNHCHFKPFTNNKQILSTQSWWTPPHPSTIPKSKFSLRFPAVTRIRVRGLKARFALGSRLADPVVLVDARPCEGKGGSVGFEAFLAGELGSRSSRGRRERVCSKSLPLLPQPGLRGAWRKLTELRTTETQSVLF